jgi:hypothetical protein
VSLAHHQAAAGTLKCTGSDRLQTLNFFQFGVEFQVMQLGTFVFNNEELEPKVAALAQALIMSYGSDRIQR